MHTVLSHPVIGFFLWLFIVISLLPVALLPLITAVPIYIFLALALSDVGLMGLFLRAGSSAHRIGAVIVVVCVGVLAVVFSQRCATTPVIRGADGLPLPGSVAELKIVELNGRRQWITLRGQDAGKPVLLFLAGGPGGTQLAATRKVLAELEKHYVVVNWDQPGAGKSYRAADFSTLTPEQYRDDALQLTHYLRERFGQERIHIMGESWGTMLGLWMAHDYPQLYHSFTAVAPMVAFLETDLYDYELALKVSSDKGDSRTLKALQKQGPPPYYGKGVARKAARYLMYLSNYMNSNPNINSSYDTFGDIFSPEYGLYDKVNYFRGLLKVMEVVWPQLWEVDFRQQITELEVPVQFIVGRHDVNAPPHLVEEYVEILKAPHKELIWFEKSGHSPWMEERARMVEVMLGASQLEQIR